jgi:hypothetical protein
MRNKIRRFSHVALGIVMLGSPMVGLAQQGHMDQGRKQAHPTDKPIKTMDRLSTRHKQHNQYYGAFHKRIEPPPKGGPKGEKYIRNEPTTPRLDAAEDRSQKEWQGD